MDDTQDLITSQTTLFGASVLNAPALQCVEETLYPAFMRADHTTSRGGVSAFTVFASSCAVRKNGTSSSYYQYGRRWHTSAARVSIPIIRVRVLYTFSSNFSTVFPSSFTNSCSCNGPAHIGPASYCQI
jgi:hypothetical protein